MNICSRSKSRQHFQDKILAGMRVNTGKILTKKYILIFLQVIQYINNEYTIIPIYSIYINTSANIPGHIAQSVTCLIVDTCLAADPGVVSLILTRSHSWPFFCGDLS